MFPALALVPDQETDTFNGHCVRVIYCRGQVWTSENFLGLFLVNVHSYRKYVSSGALKGSDVPCFFSKEFAKSRNIQSLSAEGFHNNIRFDKCLDYQIPIARRQIV